ncbi:MAG: response regulator [Actinomycetota bacterium]
MSGWDILLIEDDLGDAGLVRIAIRRGRHDCRLHHVKNSVEALAFLRRIGQHRAAPKPDLILLDLNLPGRSGHEVLEEIKADAELATIPVVVLSTSDADRDINRAMVLGADQFVTKPMDVEAFSAAIHAIQARWLGAVP